MYAACIVVTGGIPAAQAFVVSFYVLLLYIGSRCTPLLYILN